ncbi:hypothetical protein ACFLU6_14240 [Acidobacteriota bacterium]
MYTFYARHRMDISQETYDLLWNSRYVAIHYPQSKHSTGGEDTTSIDPDDYKGTPKQALKALLELGEDGGYVCAEYSGVNSCLLGKVNPKTGVELLRGKWDTYPDKTAILKAVKMAFAQEVPPSDYAVIMAGRPRQGTLQHWWNAGRAIECIVDGREPQRNVASLHPSQQEVLCSEYLLSDLPLRVGVPQLAHHLLPVGRCLRDLDILGITSSGDRLFAQVTYKSFEKATQKLNALKLYGQSSSDVLVMFCRNDGVKNIDGIYIVSIDFVFDKFCSAPTGKLWLEKSLFPAGRALTSDWSRKFDP